MRGNELVIVIGATSLVTRLLVHQKKDSLIIGRHESGYGEGSFRLDLSKELDNRMFGEIARKVNSGHRSMILNAWAGRPRTIRMPEDISTFKKINDAIVRNTIKLASHLGIERLLFMSSGGALYNCVSTPGNEEAWIDRSRIGEYGLMKLSAEESLLKYGNATGCKVSVLRVSSICSALETRSDQGVISVWSKCARQGRTLSLYNSLDSCVNFIRGEDVVDAISAVEENRVSGIFNVGSEHSQSLGDILSILETAIGKKLNIKVVSNDRRDMHMDCTKLRQLTGRFYKEIDTEYAKRVYGLVE